MFLFMCLTQAQFTLLHKHQTPVFTDTALASPPGSRNPMVWCADDLMYVLGGKTDTGRTAQMWMYDSMVDRWFRLPDGPQAFSGAIHWNYGSYLWMYGGRTSDSISDSIYRYSIPDRRWEMVPSGNGPGPRYGSPFWYSQTKLHIYGGRTDNHTIAQDLWSLDMKTLSWNLVSNTNEPGPLDDGKAAVHNNVVYLFGGEKITNKNVLWTYTGNKWNSIDILEGPVDREDQTMWHNGQYLFIVGGKYDKTVVNDAWQLDTSTMVWQQVQGVSPSDRWGGDSCTLSSGQGQKKTLIYGGATNEAVRMNDVWLYGPTTPVLEQFVDNRVFIMSVLTFVLVVCLALGYIVKKHRTIQKI